MLGWKRLLGPNALAYYEKALMAEKKVLIFVTLSFHCRSIVVFAACWNIVGVTIGCVTVIIIGITIVSIKVVTITAVVVFTVVTVVAAAAAVVVVVVVVVIGGDRGHRLRHGEFFV
jgi:hypothetical protein